MNPDVQRLPQVALEWRIVRLQRLGVVSVWRMVALVLVAFWLPASSHAHLQHFGLIHEVHADHHHDDHGKAKSGHHEHGADNHAAADGECLLSSGTTGWELLWGGLNGIPLDLVPARSVRVLPVTLEAVGLAPPGSAPPEFSTSWQFLLRAALPVRAPSFVS
ncbi:MAG: hypothetical protein AB7O66_23850 [Limisphaerales bacterium]